MDCICRACPDEYEIRNIYFSHFHIESLLFFSFLLFLISHFIFSFAYSFFLCDLLLFIYFFLTQNMHLEALIQTTQVSFLFSSSNLSHFLSSIYVQSKVSFARRREASKGSNCALTFIWAKAHFRRQKCRE